MRLFLLRWPVLGEGVRLLRFFIAASSGRHCGYIIDLLIKSFLIRYTNTSLGLLEFMARFRSLSLDIVFFKDSLDIVNGMESLYGWTRINEDHSFGFASWIYGFLFRFIILDIVNNTYRFCLNK